MNADANHFANLMTSPTTFVRRSNDPVAALLIALASALLGSALDAQSRTTNVAARREIAVGEIGRIRGQSNIVSGALTSNGELLLARTQPAELQKYDTNGKRLWTQATQSSVNGGVVVCGDTVVTLESSETWSVGKFRLSSGKVIANTPVEIERGIDPFVLGCFRNNTVVSLHARMRIGATGLAPLSFPERSVILVASDGTVTATGFSVVDSSVQVIPPLAFGRSAIRPPFAPTSSIVLVSNGELLYAAGTDTTIMMFNLDGRITGTISLRSNPVELNQEQIRETRAGWIDRNAIRWPPELKAETLYARVAALEKSTRGLTLGRMLGSGDGEVLVRRRDLDHTLLVDSDSTVYEIFRIKPAQQVIGRVTLPPNHYPIAYNGRRIITSTFIESAESKGRARQEIVIWQIMSPSNNEDQQ